jgi:hypothetical protein
MKNTKFKRILEYIVAVCLVAVAVLGVIVIKRHINAAKQEQSLTIEKEATFSEIRIGDVPVTDYVIITNGSIKAGTRLSSYIEKVTGEKVKTFLGGSHPNKINIVRDKNLAENDQRILIEGGEVTIKGRNAEDLEKQVDIFANRYLGLAFAGEEREHVLKNDSLRIIIPGDVYYTDDSWMPEREPIICLWKTTATRGVFYNSGTSLKSELMSYSDDMLYEYVRMMSACGYTGIQVTDMCSAWAYYGNYEFVHDRLRFMADAAHSLGMNFTLWVWGAEFNGYGWNDKSVEYYGEYDENWVRPYEYASENPNAQAMFDKYYSIYAELADCCDRVIAHYNDPGNLENLEDIAFYAGMLRDKFKSVNPNVNFGVSCYTHEINPRDLCKIMGTDTTVYLGACTEAGTTWQYERTCCSMDGLTFGIWSWNLTEMEIDQLAEMNVNANIIKDVYNRTAEEDVYGKPSYWSEMDSYHVLNIFSHYCAGRLLQDPNLDADELLLESARAVVGDEYAEKLYEVLCLIEEARSGDKWESFRWEYEDYCIKNKDYKADAILSKSEECLKYLDEMIDADIKDNTIPLPVSVSDLLQLIKPHVKQIHDYSQFRKDLDEAYTKAAENPDKEILQKTIDDLYKPISEYNVITGVWGVPEARAQYELTEEFCETYGLEVPQDPVFISFRKQRIYDELVTWQRKASEKKIFSLSAFQWGVAYGKEETQRLTKELVDDGLLTLESEDTVSVTDWERYCYDF